MKNVINKPNDIRLINVAPCYVNDDSDDNEPRLLVTEHSRNSIVSNRASSFESSFSLDASGQTIVRPATARSLPIPSKPNPPKINIIKSPSSDSKSQDQVNFKYSNSTPMLIKQRNYSETLKTNLDTYLDYSVSPFTTKFELIGKKSDLKTSMRKCHSSSQINEQNFSTKHQLYSQSEISEPSYLQITDDLFCGNFNFVKNEKKLCKMNIEYLIDMTNMRPDELSRRSLGKIPCNCLKQHSRMYINIEIKETDFKSLFKSFCEVNKFIQKSRRSPITKRVLIFGKNTYSSEVICAATQYLMVEYDMSLDMALKSVAKQQFYRISYNIDERYRNFLFDFEKYLSFMSQKVFGRLGLDSVDNCSAKNLQAKRDMFEENSDFFYENEVEDFDLELQDSSLIQSSMTNLVESEDKKRSSLKKNNSKQNSKLKIAWM